MVRGLGSRTTVDSSFVWVFAQVEQLVSVLGQLGNGPDSSRRASWTGGSRTGRNSLFNWCGRCHMPPRRRTRHERREPHMRRKAMVAALAVTTFFGVAACGGSSGGGSGSSGSGDANAGLTSRGPITYVQGKDNSNVVRPAIAKWNAAHPTEKVTLQGADRPGRPAARRPRAALPGQGHELRRRRRRTWCGPRSSPRRVGCSRWPTRWPSTRTSLLQADRRRRRRTTARCTPPRQASDGGLLYYRTDLVNDPAEDVGGDDGGLQDRQAATTSAATPASSRSTKASPSTPPRRSTPPAARSSDKDGATPTVDTAEAAKGLGNLVDRLQER